MSCLVMLLEVISPYYVLFIGLLKGKVDVTADARVGGNEENMNDNEERRHTVIAKMKALIELASNEEGLENMRRDAEQKEVFLTFVNTCLVHFCSSMTWRYAAYNTVISEIFTASDEAFAMLLLENNANDYKKMVVLNKKLSRKEAKPKYTKDPNNTDKFKGWSKYGIRRYNYLVKVVQMNRKLTHSIEMEVKLKDGYAKICGKDGSRNGVGEVSGDFESDDEILEAYDGFAGDDEALTDEDEYARLRRHLV